MDAQNTGEHTVTLTEWEQQVLRECPGTHAYRGGYEVLRAAVEEIIQARLERVGQAIIQASPPINYELRPDGREDPQAAAYVQGFKEAHDVVDELIRRG